jgi:hypothetical protein
VRLSPRCRVRVGHGPDLTLLAKCAFALFCGKTQTRVLGAITFPAKHVENQKRNRYLGNVQRDENDKLICPARRWTKRAGIIAFVLFLGKGLLWLGLAASAWWAFDR